MTGPAARSKSMRYLLREFLALPKSSRFRGSSVDLMGSALAPAAGIASWITQFHPELLKRESLRIVVLGATEQDSLDDGCWYSALPWLLGREDMIVSVTLVGLELFKREGPSVPRTRAGTISTDAGSRNTEFAPAKLYPCLASPYLAKQGGQTDVDLFFMFNPGFEEIEDEETRETQWLAEGQLSKVCETSGALIGVASYCDDEALAERWLLETYGFSHGSDLKSNPFHGHETHCGSWGSSLWEINAKAPPVGFKPDAGRLQRFDTYNRMCSWQIGEHGRLVTSYLGRVSEIEVISKGAKQRHAVVGTVDDVLVVSLVNGMFYEKIGDKGQAVQEVPAIAEEVLAKFPRNAPLSFEHVLWATEAFSSSFAQERRNTGNKDIQGIGECWRWPLRWRRQEWQVRQAGATQQRTTGCLRWNTKT